MYPSSEISARYFSAAKKRLGLVMSSNKLVAVQCLFLAGIYHMYTMNQFAAWKMFNAASVSCEGYLHRKERAKAADVSSGTLSLPSSEPTRHLEQRIYWSCLKSELFVPVSVKKKEAQANPNPPTDEASYVQNSISPIPASARSNIHMRSHPHHARSQPRRLSNHQTRSSSNPAALTRPKIAPPNHN